MIEISNRAETLDGAGPRGTPTVARAADVIMARATAEVNNWLGFFGVSYRAPAIDARLTDAVVDLAYSRNELSKRAVNATGDVGVWAEDVQRKASAVAAVQHRVVTDALGQHVRSIESDLVKAVSQYRALNQLGGKKFGEAVTDDWLPTPETAALFGLGAA